MHHETLADIETRIRVFQNALPHSGTFCACKALTRIAQAADAPHSAIPATDALERYEAIRDVPLRVFYNERLYLRRALSLPALPADVSARIRRGEPTFADALVVIDMYAMALEQAGKRKDANAWRSEAGRLKGALKKLASRLDKQPDQILATLANVDAELAKLTSSDFAYKQGSGSFVTFCSRIRRAVRLVDIRARRFLSTSRLTGPWKAIVDAVRGHKKHETSRGYLAKIWPLIGYCERHDLAPAQVDDKVIAALQTDLERHGVQDAFDITRNVVYAWEHLQSFVPGFPATKLRRLYRTGPSPHAVPFEHLPDAFRASWEAYAATYFRNPEETPTALENLVLDEFADPADLEIAGPQHNPDGKGNFRTVVTYAANVALDRRIRFETLRDILTPEILQAVLARVANRQKIWAERQGNAFNPKNSTLRHYATMFIAMARDLRIDQSAIASMETLRDLVDPRITKVQRRPDGTVQRIRTRRLMGPRHAKRLRQFSDPVKMLAWYDMPSRLATRVRDRIKRLKKGEQLRLQDCNDLAVAIVYAISRSAAIRPKNYVKLRITGPRRNVFLPAHHHAEGYIHIDWAEVKNGVDLDIVLPPQTVGLIELWREHARPVVAKAVDAAPDNPYLFPGRGMSHLSRAELNKHFVNRNRRYGGFVLNLHCQRHMAAKAILDTDPSKIGLVQVLLGHRTIETTQAYYAEINMIFAQRQFHKILAEHEATLRALPPKRRAA